MKEDVSTESFLERCRQAIAECTANKASTDEIYRCADMIVAVWPETGAHPMLHSIHQLAMDITEECEDCKGNSDDTQSWNELVATYQNYMAGRWTDTAQRLSVTYGLYDGDIDMNHSFGVVLIRRNGETEVQCGNAELKRVVREVTDSVNPNQTDSFFIANVRLLLPHRSGSFRLLGG